MAVLGGRGCTSRQLGSTEFSMSMDASCSVTIPTRRRILQVLRDTESEAKRIPYTSCTMRSDCAPSVFDMKMCRSLWDTPMPCYSCSGRVHGELKPSDVGYACNSRLKKCECTAPLTLDPDDQRDRPDDIEWRGDSWCDKLMRAYKTQAIRTPLENLWVYKCTQQREFGMALTNWLNLQTIPPDILYNPMRILWVASDIAEGLYVYWNEEWGKHGQTEAAYFDRLIELRIDPIITFKALVHGNYIMRLLSLTVAEFDPVGITGRVIHVLDTEAGDAFVNATTKGRRVFEGLNKAFTKNRTQTILKLINETSLTMPKFLNMVQRARMKQNEQAAKPNTTGLIIEHHNVTDDADQNGSMVVASGGSAGSSIYFINGTESPRGERSSCSRTTPRLAWRWAGRR